jgi:4a-hydroxytetrahydrobiopterin dehydratase
MATPLSTDEIQEALQELDSEWSYQDDKLSRELTFDNFRDAVSFIMRLSFEAEEHVHHPEIFNVYNTVNIQLSTHDAGDKVTDKDLKLAKAIDSLL